MKKWLFALGIYFIPFTLSAVPYYSEFRGNGYVIHFHGNINEADESQVKVFQTQYLENLNNKVERGEFEWQLYKLGIAIEVTRDSEIQSENTYPNEHPLQSPENFFQSGPSESYPYPSTHPFETYNPPTYEGPPLPHNPP